MLTIVPLEGTNLSQASQLVAERQRRLRRLEPALPQPYEDPTAVLALLEQHLGKPGAAGVVAYSETTAVGFLAGAPVLAAPTDLEADDYPERSIDIPTHGHAVAEGYEWEAYRRLYGALAGGWVAQGNFDHFVSLQAADRAALEAWVSLGFGMLDVGAVREVATLAAPETPVTVRRAYGDEVDTLQTMAKVLAAHEAESPGFIPHLATTEAAWRETVHRLLMEGRAAYFLAEAGGAAVGMVSLMENWAFSPVSSPEGSLYLDQAVVLRDARQSGIGSALLAEGFAWLRSEGIRWCTLHHTSANLAGTAFWATRGFRPLEYTLQRHVDERIAWAKPACGGPT